MRVIAGKYKRTPIQSIAGEEITRPTKDMVKEALFSTIIIDNDTKMLDLFSGTGGIGLEALSRGAKDVVFNDVDLDAVKTIKTNLDKVKEDRLVLKLDYKECCKKLEGSSFDYIYCDPPYAFGEYDALFSLINEYKLLNKKGIIIIEAKKDTELQKMYFDFKLFKEKKYGITKLLYYKGA